MLREERLRARDLSGLDILLYDEFQDVHFPLVDLMHSYT